MKYLHGNTVKERERDRQTNRQTDRQTDGQRLTNIQTVKYRETEKQTNIERHRPSRKTERHKDHSYGFWRQPAKKQLSGFLASHLHQISKVIRKT